MTAKVYFLSEFRETHEPKSMQSGDKVRRWEARAEYIRTVVDKMDDEDVRHAMLDLAASCAYMAYRVREWS
jgi:hypothetical protein